MNCKNIKYPILFSFLFFAGSIQGGYAQEASDVETGPDIELSLIHISEPTRH